MLRKARTYNRRWRPVFCRRVLRCCDRVARFSSGRDLGAPPKETELVGRFIEP
jgi:hypothetical protein